MSLGAVAILRPPPGGPWEQGAGHQAEGLTPAHNALGHTTQALLGTFSGLLGVDAWMARGGLGSG